MSRRLSAARIAREAKQVMAGVNACKHQAGYANGTRRRAFYFNLDESRAISAALTTILLHEIPGEETAARYMSVIERLSPLNAEWVKELLEERKRAA